MTESHDFKPGDHVRVRDDPTLFAVVMEIENAEHPGKVCIAYFEPPGWYSDPEWRDPIDLAHLGEPFLPKPPDGAVAVAGEAAPSTRRPPDADELAPNPPTRAKIRGTDAVPPSEADELRLRALVLDDMPKPPDLSPAESRMLAKIVREEDEKKHSRWWDLIEDGQPKPADLSPDDSAAFDRIAEDVARAHEWGLVTVYPDDSAVRYTERGRIEYPPGSVDYDHWSSWLSDVLKAEKRPREEPPPEVQRPMEEPPREPKPTYPNTDVMTRWLKDIVLGAEKPDGLSPHESAAWDRLAADVAADRERGYIIEIPAE